MIYQWILPDLIDNGILIPKYYDKSIIKNLNKLNKTHVIYKISNLIESSDLLVDTGDELGKEAYGTGDIPFIRTSDIANWEIKTSPKQGVADSYYAQYGPKHDLMPNDILLVRDGTYLIGTNCIISPLDGPLLYQSHLLKFRLHESSPIDGLQLFLSLNSALVQTQIRSKQFTADIIDTIGQRFRDIQLPIPHNNSATKSILKRARKALDSRALSKALIKQLPWLMENCLLEGTATPLQKFTTLSIEEASKCVQHKQTQSELGDFQSRWLNPSDIENAVYLPKYYDSTIDNELEAISSTSDIFTVKHLIDNKVLSISTGDEIGKMAYGTGDIPFLRTSDFSDWEIKHDPKQGVSNEIFDQYSIKQDIQPGDILLVRDGTYLVGQSCIITEADSRSLFCGGLIKIRINKPDIIDEWYLLAVLNSFIVKRQMRSKQFTRDVIDTLGTRFTEVKIPVIRKKLVRKEISDAVAKCVQIRIKSRLALSDCIREFVPS